MTALRVPFLDLQAMHSELGAKLEESASRVIASGRLLLGPELETFETAWAAAVGADHAIGVGSGLDALTLGLRAVGVGPGDEVVVPSHTFVATWLAVLHAGATPVPVDVNGSTGAWEVAAVAAAITPRTRALLPVHLYGHPVELTPLVALAERQGLAVVDDAAQAHGSLYRGRPVGGLTTATAWSFYPGKNLGALGDGGAVTTSDSGVARRLRSLRNYGSSQKYIHDEVGWNSRLDELQSAFLTVKLRRLADDNARRVELARRYEEGLSALDVVLPQTADWASPVWHLYVIRTPQRDRLRDHLAACGVETGVHYPVPPHRQTAFAGTPLADAHLPGADRLAGEVLSLPMGPHLTSSQQDAVIDAMRSFHA